MRNPFSHLGLKQATAEFSATITTFTGGVYVDLRFSHPSR